MKRAVEMAAAALMAASAFAYGEDSTLDRRVQKLEEAIARVEARLAKLEANADAAARGGKKDSGMMGGRRPNEQWRTPSGFRAPAGL